MIVCRRNNSNGSLYHHGIKGQKWGVRRYEKKNEIVIKKDRKKMTKGQKIATGILLAYGTMGVIQAVKYVEPIYKMNTNVGKVFFKIFKLTMKPFFFIKELTK